MKYHLPLVAFAIWSALALSACGQSPLDAPLDGLLLLKNGRTLVGKVSRTGDFYIVATADTEMQIRSHDADAVCRDWEEAYRHKSTRINPRCADDRLELAQWCLECGLIGHAAREITEAYRIDDLHPRVPIMERRLKAAMIEPKPVTKVEPIAVVAPHEDDRTTEIVKNVPQEALLDFTTRVQPLLVNYCATAGCHGPRPASEFQLQRVYLHETRDARLVRANLAAVLAQVDRKDPQQSRLLTATLTPHGGAKKPIFHAHNADHYRQLAVWVMRVAAHAPEATAARTPATVDAATQTLLQQLPLAVPPPSEPSAPPPPVEPQLPPPPPAAAAAPPNAGVDPFDPAPFNERRREKKAEAEATPAADE